LLTDGVSAAVLEPGGESKKAADPPPAHAAAAAAVADAKTLTGPWLLK